MSFTPAKTIKPSILGLAFTTSLLFLTFFTPFFIARFKAYDVYANFSEKNSREEVNAQFMNIQKYLLPFTSYQLDPEFFSQEDILHMQDVKALYNIIYLIFAISLVGFIAGLHSLRKSRSKIKTGKFEYVLSILLFLFFLWAIIDFSSLFTIFHKISFRNNYWSLDPESSSLIKFFPEGLFLESTILLIILIISFYGFFLKLLSQIQKK